MRSQGKLLPAQVWTASQNDASGHHLEQRSQAGTSKGSSAGAGNPERSLTNAGDSVCASPEFKTLGRGHPVKERCLQFCEFYLQGLNHIPLVNIAEKPFQLLVWFKEKEPFLNILSILLLLMRLALERSYFTRV